MKKLSFILSLLVFCTFIITGCAEIIQESTVSDIFDDFLISDEEKKDQKKNDKTENTIGRGLNIAENNGLVGDWKRTVTLEDGTAATEIYKVYPTDGGKCSIISSNGEEISSYRFYVTEDLSIYNSSTKEYMGKFEKNQDGGIKVGGKAVNRDSGSGVITDTGYKLEAKELEKIIYNGSFIKLENGCYDEVVFSEGKISIGYTDYFVTGCDIADDSQRQVINKIKEEQDLCEAESLALEANGKLIALKSSKECKTFSLTYKKDTPEALSGKFIVSGADYAGIGCLEGDEQFILLFKNNDVKSDFKLSKIKATHSRVTDSGFILEAENLVKFDIPDVPDGEEDLKFIDLRDQDKDQYRNNCSIKDKKIVIGQNSYSVSYCDIIDEQKPVIEKILNKITDKNIRYVLADSVQNGGKIIALTKDTDNLSTKFALSENETNSKKDFINAEYVGFGCLDGYTKFMILYSKNNGIRWVIKNYPNSTGSMIDNFTLNVMGLKKNDTLKNTPYYKTTFYISETDETIRLIFNDEKVKVKLEDDQDYNDYYVYDMNISELSDVQKDFLVKFIEPSEGPLGLENITQEEFYENGKVIAFSKDDRPYINIGGHVLDSTNISVNFEGADYVGIGYFDGNKKVMCILHEYKATRPFKAKAIVRNNTNGDGGSTGGGIIDNPIIKDLPDGGLIGTWIGKTKSLIANKPITIEVIMTINADGTGTIINQIGSNRTSQDIKVKRTTIYYENGNHSDITIVSKSKIKCGDIIYEKKNGLPSGGGRTPGLDDKPIGPIKKVNP